VNITKDSWILTIGRRDFQKASDVLEKGRHEISKISGYFPQINRCFWEKGEVFSEKFHETRQKHYRIKTGCPFLSESKKNNVSKTAFFLTLCKAFNKNCLNHDFHCLNHDFQDLKD
jgi:hypothetical protein